MINNNDLKKASENFYIKKDKLYNEILTSPEKKKKRTPIRPISRLAILFISLCVLLAGCVTAYAVSPELRNYLNLWFVGQNQHNDTVPEGYVGIYTVEDLDNIRNNLDEKYILMNDLTFSENDFLEGGSFEGGWEAIGDNTNPFTGKFDGNGHVISNLTLKQGEIYTGLFGVAGCLSDDTVVPDDKYSYEYDGMIKNLGLDGVKADIIINDDSSRNMGSIIASGIYVVSCYADNVNINVSFENFEILEDIETTIYENSNPTIITTHNDKAGDTRIGGLCGTAEMIDSCFANAEINVKDENNYRSLYNIDEFLLIGGVSAKANVAVTSYFTGSIKYEEENYGSNEILGYNSFLPLIISEERFTNIIDKISSVNTDDRRAGKTFRALYNKRPYITQRDQDRMLKNIDANTQYYFLEAHVTQRETIRLEKIILTAFTEEEFRQGSIDDGIKANINYCYTLEEGKSYEQNYFENFDFIKIWVMKDGVPKLQIFEK